MIGALCWKALQYLAKARVEVCVAEYVHLNNGKDGDRLRKAIHLPICRELTTLSWKNRTDMPTVAASCFVAACIL